MARWPLNDTATLLRPRCVPVLHTATPENWFLRLFESTGSAVASIMERVRSLPGTWEPGELIRVRSKLARRNPFPRQSSR